MAFVNRLFDALFGGGRNIVAQTAEVFRVNAEAQAQRGHDARAGALAQFAAEFAQPRRGWFDALVDGLNRLPRPMMAFGTISLFVAAMVDPVWFAARMVALAEVPEPLWYILGAIVGFFFGARELHKSRSMRSVDPERVRRTVDAIREIEAIDARPARVPASDAAQVAEPPARSVDRGLVERNPALAEALARQKEAS